MSAGRLTVLLVGVALLLAGCANPYASRYAEREGELIRQRKDGNISREDYDRELEQVYQTEEPPLADLLRSVVGGASSDELSEKRQRELRP